MERATKKVLLIAYYFPPLGGGGVQRPLQWTRLLPAHGWQPTVLTVEGGYWSSYDEAGLARLPAGLRVIRTPLFTAVGLRNRMLGRRVASAPTGTQPDTPTPRSGFRRAVVDRIKPLWQTPDEFFGWYPFAVRAAGALLGQERFDAILSTAPPWTAHWIGRRLRREFGIPWIADFRDAWTQMPGYPHKNPLQLAIERRMERAVLERADRVIATTEPTRAGLVELAPRLAARSAVIANGYDPALYRLHGPTSCEPGEHFRLLFTGTLLLGQDVGKFIDLLTIWIGADAEKRQRVRLAYAGPESEAVLRAARRYDAEGLIEDHGYVSHHESARLQRQADVLLSICYDDRTATSVLPGKIPEYLAARRPILCVSGPGPRTEIIERAGAGVVVHPEDREGVVDALESCWRQWKRGALEVDSDLEWIEAHFSRERQVERLAGLLEGAAAEIRPSGKSAFPSGED